MSDLIRFIDPTRPDAQHVDLTCVNHPELSWFTKNIDYIGARSIFYNSTVPECHCPLSALVLVPA